MKNIIYFIVLFSFLTSCKDDFYSEGYIKTIRITELTNHSASLSGNIQIVTAGENTSLNIRRRGFVFGTTTNELTAVKNNLSGMVYDQIASEGDYSGSINGLSPSTKYYAKAFVVFVQSEKRGRVVYYNGKLIYLYEENEIGEYYYNSEYCNVLVFYGNTIEFTTKE